MNGNYQLVDLRKETESESGTEANKEIYISLKRAADRGIGVLCLAEAGNFFSTVEKAEDGTVGVSVVKATATTSGDDTVWAAIAETHTFTAEGVCSIDSVTIGEAPEPTPVEPEFTEVEVSIDADADEYWTAFNALHLAGTHRAVKFVIEDSDFGQHYSYFADAYGTSSVIEISYLKMTTATEEHEPVVEVITLTREGDDISKVVQQYTLTAPVVGG